MIEKFKSQKAITLIALVITIVVLIMLASVAITLSLGDNGVFKKAAKAKEDTLVAQNAESMQIAEATNSMDEIIGSSDRNTNNTNQTWKKYMMNENGYVYGSEIVTLPTSFNELYVKVNTTDPYVYEYNILYDALKDTPQNYTNGFYNGLGNYCFVCVSKTTLSLSIVFNNSNVTSTSTIEIWYK